MVSIPFFAMLFSFVTAYLLNREQDRASDWVQHTTLMRAGLDQLLTRMTGAERGVRSYLSNQNEELLEPYRFAEQTIPEVLDGLFELAEDDLSQTTHLRDIRALAESQVALLAALVERSGTGVTLPASEARAATVTEAKHQADQLRQKIGGLDAELDRLQLKRTVHLEQVERWRSSANIGGVIVGLLGACLAMQLFAKLAQHLETAGLLISERSRALEDSLAREQQARGVAERANQAKSQFLSRTSHELRTPLNSILGFGQVLEISQLPPQETQCVQYILKGGRHLLELVDEVLDLAKVESGEIRLNPSAVILEFLSRECIAFVERLAQAHAVTCTVEESPSFLVPVWADKHRLRQVLLNLISNAIKYNREGGQVMVSCQQTSEGRLRLKVRDTGHGISTEDLARLFMPFERLGHEYGEIKGTGLGLVVSRQIAEAMNGSMGVESQLNEGTTFWIELPKAEVIKSEPVMIAPASPPMVTRGEEAPVATVLYIEDNPSNLQVVEMVIARFRPQWRFLAAREGYSGLQLIRERLPGCILLDMQLPSLNGGEVLAELRAQPQTRDIPVLLVSADVMTYNREAMRELGATDYLPKPFEISELLQKLDSYLSEPTQRASVAQ